MMMSGTNYMTLECSKVGRHALRIPESWYNDVAEWADGYNITATPKLLVIFPKEEKTDYSVVRHLELSREFWIGLDYKYTKSRGELLLRWKKGEDGELIVLLTEDLDEDDELSEEMQYLRPVDYWEGRFGFIVKVWESAGIMYFKFNYKFSKMFFDAYSREDRFVYDKEERALVRNARGYKPCKTSNKLTIKMSAKGFMGDDFMKPGEYKVNMVDGKIIFLYRLEG